MTTQHTVDAYAALLAAIDAGDEAGAQRLLQDANNAYYNSGSSPLTDAEFDDAQARYTAAFGLPIKTAPTIKGRSDRHAAVPHDWPLLSGWLAKADSLPSLNNWLRRRGAAAPGGAYIASPKWDGLSIVVTYDRLGRVVRALTRGDDGLGVDVTSLFAGEIHFGEHDLNLTATRFGVKYELVMSWEALERMNDALGKTYKNPRNTVAGIASADDGVARREYITLVPLDIEWDGCTDTRLQRLEFMERLFCPQGDTPATFQGNGNSETPFFWWVTEQSEDLVDVFTEVHGWRSNEAFSFMLDGIVVEYADPADIERLGGRRSDCPDYAVAVKFPSLVGRSRVVSLDWDLGNTGRLTPVVNYEPINLDGRTFTRTSIANMVRFDELRLCPGTPILIEVRGDILGWLDRDGEDPPGATPFSAPDGCTYTFNDRGQRVFAYVDAPLAGRCERMMVKCGVKGVRIETISKLVNAGVVTNLADMWSLTEKFDQIAAIPGLGATSADLLCSAIDAKLAKGLWDWEILASVGINGVGRTLSKDALKVFTLSELLAGNCAEGVLAGVLGPERARFVVEGAREYTRDIQDLVQAALAGGGLHATKEATSSYDGPFYKVVVTGDLNRWERDEFKTLIETMGHKMVGSISKNVNFLITNTPTSGTVKNKKALELGVEILTEEQAIARLGLDTSVSARASSPRSEAAGRVLGSLDDL